MQEERKMILTMLREGKITPDEAQDLLEAVAFGNKAVSDDETTEQWTRLKQNLEEARDVVEDRLERAREQIETRLEEARVRIDAARDKAKTDAHSPIDGLEDVVVTVERGFAQFVKELPEAIARLTQFDFGTIGGYPIETVYEGTFAESMDGPSAVVSTRNGSITWETWDEPGYKVIVKTKVRAEDKQTAAERAAEATLWDEASDGFRLEMGDVAGVSASVHVKLPRNVQYRLDATTRNGSVRVRNVSLAAGRVQTANGSISLANVKARRLQTATANGAIRLTGTADDWQATTAHGSIDGRMAEPVAEPAATHFDTAGRVHWNLQTSNGAVRVHVPGEGVGYRVDLQTVTGRVRVALPAYDAVDAADARHDVTWESPDYGTSARQIAVTARTAHGSITVGTDDEEA